MRTIKTFIVRIFLDSETPGCLRGAVQELTQPQALNFKDEAALLEFLHSYSGEPGSPAASPDEPPRPQREDHPHTPQEESR